MGLLSFNPGNFSDALAGLSQGLLAYGSGQPQGLLTVPAIVARSRQDRLQNTRQQQLLDMEQQKFQQEQTEFQRRLAHDQQMQSAWAGLTGTGATGPNNGRPGGVAPQQAGMLSSFSPEVQTYLKALPPEQGMQVLGGLLTQKPDKPHLVQAYINGHMEYVPEDQAAGLQSAAPERPPQGPGPSPLEIRAAGAGLVPGTPEYKKFMLTGGEQQAGVDPKDEGTLRKEFNDLPEVKSFNTVAPIYNSMVEAGKRNTRASDLNLVYGLAKIMDPGSVVREGEQVMVMNTASLPDWLVGQINRYNGGSALEGNTRRAIMAEAKSRMDQMAAQVDARRQQYTSLGSDYGYDPNHIVGSPYSIQTPSFSVAPRGGQPMGGADAILDRYKVPQ